MKIYKPVGWKKYNLKNTSMKNEKEKNEIFAKATRIFTYLYIRNRIWWMNSLKVADYGAKYVDRPS